MRPGRVPFILKCSENHFTAEELQCLQDHGHQLQSIATAHVPPMGSEEQKFVYDVINVQENKSISDLLLKETTHGKFQVFLKYMAARLKEGNPLEISSRKTTESRRRRLEDRARRGGHSTDNQENRFRR